MKKNSIFLLLFMSCLTAYGTVNLPQDTSKPLIRKSSLVALPLAFFTPETRFGGGAALLYAFRLRNQSDSSRPSQFQLGFAYTQERQILSYLPFQLFLKNGDYNIYGELGYYRYFYFFYGIGNEATAQREIFSVDFPRIRVTALKRVYPNLYFGLRYWRDNYNILEVEATGKLATGNVAGSKGSTVSSLGIVTNYDSRDNIFYPRKGWLIEVVGLRNDRTLGSNFNFSRLSFDASTYTTNKWDHTLALNAWVNLNFGDVPFNEMGLIGGSKKMRGYYEGRYRDKKLWMLQSEYRMPQLFWRLGLVFFASVGSVADNIGDFRNNQVHYAVGTGLRILLSDKEGVNIRIDAGLNEDGEVLPYITVSEAF